MAAQKKHRKASNPYNLRKIAEILIESDNAFLNGFSRSGSVSRLNTDSDIDSIITNLVSHYGTKSDDTSPVVKHEHDFKTSRKVTRRRGKVMSDLMSKVQSDQALIN